MKICIHNIMSVIRLFSQFQTILLLLYDAGAGTLFCFSCRILVIPIWSYQQGAPERTRTTGGVRRGMYTLFSAVPASSISLRNISTSGRQVSPSQLSEFQLCRNPLLPTCTVIVCQDCRHKVLSMAWVTFLKNLFIYFYFWLCQVFLAGCGLSLVAASGGYFSLWCAGFSLQWLLLLWSTGSRCTCSVVVACRLSSCGPQALECRLSSCGAQAQLLCSMWDLPRPGIEPMSPALAGGFLTTVPPGKSWPG